MKKLFLPFIGLGAIALAMSLNLSHAADGYGLLKNSLALQVLAQSSSSGGSSSGGSSSGGSSSGGSSSGGSSSGSSSGGNSSGEKPQKWRKETGNCKWEYTGQKNATFTITGLGTFKYDSDGNFTYTAYDAHVRCHSTEDAGEQCIAQNCPTSPGK